MASRVVTVLAPNGHRQTVKCTLNTTILQILEDVCKKQGFNSSEYDIKHHNKVLDLSLTVRFSGIPNNAQLELAASAKSRTESEVTVALNLEDNSRLTGNFMPSSTLQDILDRLYKNNKPNPVVIYMRQEIYGEDLKKINLRSLGLTGGRAMMRIVHKNPEELKTQANVSNVIPSKPVVEKPYKRVFQPIDREETHQTTSKLYESTNSGLSQPRPLPAQPDYLKLAKNELVENKKFPDECSQMEVDSPVNDTSNSVMDVDEVTTSTTLDQTPSEDIKEMKMEDFPFTGERKGLIFHIESGNPRKMDDLPDDFFELKKNDLIKLMQQRKKESEEAEAGSPLQTAAQRQLEEAKEKLRKLEKYRKCIIRIQFPDRFILQGVFLPEELVQAVSEFVREHLASSDLPFHLYTTPPKFILPEDKSLIDLNCVPSVLLHFGVDEAHKNDPIEFLREDLKDKLTTSSVASIAAQKIRAESKNEDFDRNPVAGCSKDSNSVNKSTKRNTSSGG